MKKFILIGSAITLFAFSSSAFAQYKQSCAEFCLKRCQGAGQYANGCYAQCPGNCEAIRAKCAAGDAPGWSAQRKAGCQGVGQQARSTGWRADLRPDYSKQQ